MISRINQSIRTALLIIALSAPAISCATPQSGADGPEPALAALDSLRLPPAKATELSHALAAHDYVGAEKILLPEIRLQDKSEHAAGLLSFLGGVYYLDRDYLHAAVAWKKSEAIQPLQPTIQFSLAMSYIELNHRDWARAVLVALSLRDPRNALYPYWLGRLDYDRQAYSDAIAQFRKTITLAPKMAQAYDNLGLCYYQQNENEPAIKNFKQAIDLEIGKPHPSAWPWYNLAITLELLNRNLEAEADLREVIRLNPQFAKAYYELGNVLEHQDRVTDAIVAWHSAVRIDPTYAEPHYALVRMYWRQGDKSSAEHELEIYLRLHHASTGSSLH